MTYAFLMRAWVFFVLRKRSPRVLAKSKRQLKYNRSSAVILERRNMVFEMIQEYTCISNYLHIKLT